MNFLNNYIDTLTTVTLLIKCLRPAIAFIYSRDFDTLQLRISDPYDKDIMCILI